MERKEIETKACAQAREDAHQEIHNRNHARNRRGHGVWHNVPRGRASQITKSDDWAGYMSAARCTIMAIVLERLLWVPSVSLKGRRPETAMVYGAF